MSEENAGPLSLEEVQGLVQNNQLALGAISPLLRTLRSSDEELRAWAGDALSNIELVPAHLADSIRTFCNDESAPVASWACKLLSRMAGPPASVQISLSQTVNTHPIIGVRQQAVIALSSISGLTECSLNALKNAAAGDDPRLVRLASEALAKNKAA